MTGAKKVPQARPRPLTSVVSGGILVQFDEPDLASAGAGDNQGGAAIVGLRTILA
jgi:hypothetical protein